MTSIVPAPKSDNDLRPASEPKVAVVMPAFNGERYVEDAIESVRAQTFAGWELVVVDDGSRDRTADIVRWRAREDSRIRLIQHTNAGQGRTRNVGISASAAPWIGFIDQDDLWEPHKLERQLRIVEEGQADVAFSDARLFGPRAPRFRLGTPVGRFDGAAMHALLIPRNRIPILSSLVSRALLARVGYIEESLTFQNCDDYDLWLRLADAGASFVGTDECLVQYRMHSEQASKNTIPMLTAELAVIHRHAGCPGVDRATLVDRYQQLYRDLSDQLVAVRDFVQLNLRTAECRRVISGWSPLFPWEEPLAAVAPFLYPPVRRVARRACVSARYRVIDPLRRLGAAVSSAARSRLRQ